MSTITNTSVTIDEINQTATGNTIQLEKPNYHKNWHPDFESGWQLYLLGNTTFVDR